MAQGLGLHLGFRFTIQLSGLDFAYYQVQCSLAHTRHVLLSHNRRQMNNFSRMKVRRRYSHYLVFTRYSISSTPMASMTYTQTIKQKKGFITNSSIIPTAPLPQAAKRTKYFYRKYEQRIVSSKIVTCSGLTW